MAGCFRSGVLSYGEMPGAWAIEFWCQFTGNLADHPCQGILDLGEESRYGHCNPAVFFDSRGRGILNTVIAANGDADIDLERATRGGTPIKDHQWHHILLVFFGSGTKFGVVDRVDIIVDGVQQSLDRHGFTSAFNMEGRVCVGAAGRSDLSDAFQGRIDEVAFYDLSRLTEKQIETRVNRMAVRHIAASRITSHNAESSK
jgi:hypothetical protein